MHRFSTTSHLGFKNVFSRHCIISAALLNKVLLVWSLQSILFQFYSSNILQCFSTSNWIWTDYDNMCFHVTESIKHFCTIVKFKMLHVKPIQLQQPIWHFKYTFATQEYSLLVKLLSAGDYLVLCLQRLWSPLYKVAKKKCCLYSIGVNPPYITGSRGVNPMDSSPAAPLPARARLRKGDSVMDGSGQIHSSNELMNKYILFRMCRSTWLWNGYLLRTKHSRVWIWICMGHVCKWTCEIRIRHGVEKNRIKKNHKKDTAGQC